MKNLLVILGAMLTLNLFAETVTMTCPSISCSSCEGKITSTLSKMEGIDKNSVKVNLEKKTVTFDYKITDKNKNDAKAKLEEKLTSEMKDLGYPIVGELAWADTTTATTKKK